MTFNLVTWGFAVVFKKKINTISSWKISWLLWRLLQDNICYTSFCEVIIAIIYDKKAGVEINFFNNLPIGQVISNVYLPEKILTRLKKIGTISIELNFRKTYVKCIS